MNIRDITTNLASTCEKLVTLLDNAAFDALMRAACEESEQLEEDRDRLEDAIYRNDRDTMQAMLAKYHDAVNRQEV